MTRNPPLSTTRRSLLGAGAASLGLLAAPGLLHAQEEKFPSKVIEVVTHAGVGGGTDITARMMMVQAPAALGTEFTVVNRTAGSGAAALQYAASRPRDGHTILLITQTHLLTMLRNKSLPQFDDLVGVARATEDPQVIMVKAGSPLADPRAFVEASKERGLKYGGTHVGSVDHVAIFSFARAGGFKAPTLVPFRGGGDIVINLVGGNIDVALLNPAEAEAQITAGEVKPVFVLSRQRLANMPEVPTAQELGIRATAATTRGFVVLKGTPEDRVAKLEAGLVKAMSGQVFQSYLKSSGQAADSVAGRQEWEAQLAEFNEQSREALTTLGLLR
ncbi:Bug family tripartite tricarboxylate transporter substrate binding protein [Teichococcus coralli]|nr:tripartite tricarboxylate transporter substrate binding protein [Pseudoroseomonas coralli]